MDVFSLVILLSMAMSVGHCLQKTNLLCSYCFHMPKYFGTESIGTSLSFSFLITKYYLSRNQTEIQVFISIKPNIVKTKYYSSSNSKPKRFKISLNCTNLYPDKINVPFVKCPVLLISSNSLPLTLCLNHVSANS